MTEPPWNPGPYSFRHVDYFADLPGMQAGTFEISDEDRTPEWLGQAQTVEQARLFTASPDLAELVTEALQLKGGWREAIAELEDFCSEPVRLKNMLAALNQLDVWAKKATEVIKKARGEV